MKPRYIQIHCERKRRADSERLADHKVRDQRPRHRYPVGKVYALEVEEGWMCAYCREPVAIAW